VTADRKARVARHLFDSTVIVRKHSTEQQPAETHAPVKLDPMRDTALTVH